MRQQVPLFRFGLSRLAIGLVITLLPGFVAADVQDYILEFPAQQMISYKIEFEVLNPGRLAMEMNWTGNRVVSFKLEGPNGSVPTMRRSGTPPLRLHYDVDATLASAEGQWKLSIRGLPAHAVSSGVLTLYLPEGQETPEAVPAARQTPPPPPDEAWLRPARPSGALSPERERLVETTEEFRASVADRKARDRYDWQTSMLRYLAEQRDNNATPPDRKTRLMLERSAEAVRRVEKLSLSTDPFVVNPPKDRGLRRAWLALRERRVAPLELELDSMLHSIHKGQVPELYQEPWYARFVSCLMACEQYFEERGRLGARGASNRHVVDEQWERILLAADALDSLAVVVETEQPED